ARRPQRCQPVRIGCLRFRRWLGKPARRVQTLRRYSRTASGANTSMVPTHHAIACMTSLAVAPPRGRARTADAVAETGWLFAKACSQPGMDETGTNAEEAKTSGASTGNAAAWADSGSPTASPTTAKTHDIA